MNILDYTLRVCVFDSVNVTGVLGYLVAELSITTCATSIILCATFLPLPCHRLTQTINTNLSTQYHYSVTKWLSSRQLLIFTIYNGAQYIYSGNRKIYIICMTTCRISTRNICVGSSDVMKVKALQKVKYH